MNARLNYKVNERKAQKRKTQNAQTVQLNAHRAQTQNTNELNANQKSKHKHNART